VVTTDVSGATGPGPATLNAAILRIRGADGGPVGVGFLVAPDTALTCAHVVAGALPGGEGRPAGDAWLTVDLPLAAEGARHAPVAARVVHRVPFDEGGGGDVAVLLLDEPPPGAAPVSLCLPGDVWAHPMRTFGFPAGRDQGVWHPGRLRGRQAAGWLQAELAEPEGYRVGRGFSGAPVWDEELGAVVGMVVAAETGSPAVSYLIPTDALLAAWPPLRRLALPELPFKGLDAFREDDAGLFHGRDEESRDLADLVRTEPVVTLVGPSGCGKSSLAMAGVVPLLRRDGFAAVVLRPSSGSSPLAALAAALLPLAEPDTTGLRRLTRIRELETELTVHGLADLLPLALEQAGARRLLVVVDQFEESLSGDPDAAADLARVLFADPAPPELRVLVTLRGDFLDDALARPAVGDALGRRVHALTPMSGAGLCTAVTGPVADLPAVGYEEGLVDRIVADAGEAPGALPLVSFALTRLWAEREGGLLTLRAYERIGGIRGALGRYAGAAWREHVAEAEQEDARRLFTRLVRVPAGAGAVTRRLVARTELTEAQWRTAGRLATARLLVTGRDAEGAETVELAHETLIGGWDRLRDWVEEDREFLAWRDAVRGDADRWEQAGRAPGLLPATVVLDAARRWLAERPDDLNAREADFLERGRRHHAAGRRRRRSLFTGLGVLLALALVFGALYAYQRQVSAEAGRNSDSRAMAGVAEDVARQDPALSVMLALAAYRLSPTKEAQDAVLADYVAYRERDRLLSTSALSDLAGYQVSSDGDVLLARSHGGRAVVFVRDAAGTVRSTRLPGTRVTYPMVSADGRRVAFVDDEGALFWYDVHRDADSASDLTGPGHRLPKAPGATDQLYSDTAAALSADGRFAATVAHDEIVWWDLRTGRIGGRLSADADDETYSDVWFGGDGHTLLGLVDVSPGGHELWRRLRAFDLESGKRRTVVDRAEDIGVSGDGAHAVVCRHQDDDAVYTRHLIADGSARGRPYRVADGVCWRPTVGPAGRRVVLPEDGWTLADLTKGRKVARGPLEGTPLLYGRLLSSDGRLYLATCDKSGVLYTRMPSGAGEISVSQAALTPDGRSVVSVAEDGSRIQRRPVDGGSRLLAHAGHRTPYRAPEPSDRIRFDAGGTLLAERVGRDEIEVRRVSSLEPVTRVTTAEPPPAGDDEGGLTYSWFFGAGGDLVTRSGTRVQRWDARTGEPAGGADLRELGLVPRGDGAEAVPVSRAAEAGRVAVVVPGDGYLHVVDLRGGGKVARLRIRRDALAVSFDPTGRYFAVLRKGGLLELWTRSPLRRRVGPLAVDTQTGDDFAGRFLEGDQGRYLLATKNRVRIYRVGSQSYERAYDLGLPGSDPAGTGFVDAAANGSEVLHFTSDFAHGRNGGPLSLRPRDWQRDLCRLIGARYFTEAERDRLPVDIPQGPVCPSSG
jgi:hypothetical protein